MLLSETEDINTSIPYFKKAIVTNPKRTKERNITSLACYHLSHKLLQQGNLEEARNYYRIGEKSMWWRSEKDRERYNALRSELYERRLFGKISYVPDDSSYGFIEREDAPGQSIFVHRTAFIPAISGKELKGLIGIRVEFNIEKTEEGLQARNVKIV